MQSGNTDQDYNCNIIYTGKLHNYKRKDLNTSSIEFDVKIPDIYPLNNKVRILKYFSN